MSGNLFGADNSLQSFLIEFHRHPEKMMNKLPPEIRDGKVIDRGFLNDEILNRELLEGKEVRRKEVMSRAKFDLRLMSIIGDGDDPRTLIDNGVALNNIVELDQRGLMKHSLPYEIWSDTYWPT